MKHLFIWLNMILKKRRELKRWKRIVTVLAAVITFATTYALILPAITVEKDHSGDVAGMYLEKTADQDELQEENALEPAGVVIDAEPGNEAVSEDGTVLTDAEIPEYYDSQEENDGEAEDEVITDALPVKTLVASDSDYTVTLTYDEISGIPEEAYLSVSEIAQDSEEYQTYLDETKKAMGLTEEETLPRFAARFFDIKIMVDEQEFTPESGVSVEITYEEPLAEDPDTEVNAVHFADEAAEAEVIEADTSEVLDGGTATVEFTAESFSVYGVIYTVDFQYEADGETYEFSIHGGGAVSLYRLVEELGIDTTETAETFVADVENVEFSNPELVWAGKVDETVTVGELKERIGLEAEYSADLTADQIAEINAQTVDAGDWVLISLKPFNTNESLTITMKNGDMWTFKVTDAQITRVSDIKSNESYVAYVNKGNDYYAIYPDFSNGSAQVKAVKINIPGGSTLANALQRLDSSYSWSFEKRSYQLNGHSVFSMHPVAASYYSMALYYGLRLDTQSNDFSIYRDGNGFIFEGWPGGYGQTLYLNDSLEFTASNYGANRSRVYLFKKEYKQDIPNGQYAIVYKSGDKYYALDNNGGTVEVEYDSVKGEVVKTGETSLVWNWTYNHINNGVFYEVREESGYSKYINLKNGNIVQSPWSDCDVLPDSGNTFTMRGENGQYLSWRNGAFVSADDNPISFVLAKVVDPPKQYTLTVTVNEAEWGTVRGVDWEGNETGDTDQFVVHSEYADESGIGLYDCSGRVITATPKEGYLFDHWEIYNLRFDGDTEPVLDGEFSLYQDGELKAFFKKDTSVNDEMTKKEMEDQLKAWASEMLSDNVNVSKTAQVSNYKDRIYEVTLSASSGVRRVVPSIDLEFITDVSRSMYFPATLTPVTTFTQGTTASRYWLNNRWNWSPNDSTLYDWLNTYGDTDTVYYTISDNSSATVDAIYYGGSDVNPGDDKYYANWRYYDSSNVNPPDGVNHAGIRVPRLGAVEPWGHPLTGVLYEQVGSLVRMDYLQAAAVAASDVLYGTDPTARIGLVTFAATAYDSHFYTKNGTDSNGKTFSEAISTVTLYGGTNQKEGIEKGIELYTNNQRDNPTPKRVAILITDGAPNQSGCDWTTIPEAATQLKDLYGTDSVELFTIGLSMNMVGDENREGLQDIATGGASGDHWYEANNGAALVSAIKDIMSRIVDEAALKGDVTDTIDEAFYPVTSTGTPLKKGDYIDLNGELLETIPSDGKYGEIDLVDGKFVVKWNDQVVGYSANGTPQWTGKVFVKAKEDYLGGNTVNTNVGTDDRFQPEKYVIDDNDYDMITGDDIKLRRDFTTPYVNVDELSLTRNDTEWTLYLGTEVEPKEQVKALLDEIKVREVVSASTNHMITDAGQMLGTSDSGESEEFYLRDAFSNLTDEQWDSKWEELLENGSASLEYTGYGHNSGSIQFTLVKVGGTADYGSHAVTVSGKQVEKYILSAQYIPSDVQEVAYMTTLGGSPGQTTGTMESVNNHIINVFQKGLKLIKVDMLTGDMIDPAEFTLSGKGKEDVVKTTVNSEVTFNPLEKPEAASSGYESYSLEETKAPAGYIRISEVLTVNLNLTDSYTDPKTGAVLTDKSGKALTAPPASGLYNLTETSNLTIGGISTGFFERVSDVGNADSETAVVTYKIRNNPGAVLPATGGPGTTLIYLLGIMLTCIAGAGLVMRKKRIV